MRWSPLKGAVMLAVFLVLTATAFSPTYAAGNETAPGVKPDTAQFFEDLGILPIPPILDPITFLLDDLNGRRFSMHDFRGKIVFMNFWATWCPACIVEMPAMEKLHRRMKDRPFAMVAVNLQEPAATVKRFMEKNGLSFLTLLDTEAQLGAHLGIRQIPTTFIIDGDGRIIGTALGPREWGSEKSVALFEHLIDHNVTIGK